MCSEIFLATNVYLSELTAIKICRVPCAEYIYRKLQVCKSLYINSGTDFDDLSESLLYVGGNQLYFFINSLIPHTLLPIVTIQM